jgi:hypothetical protein
MNTRASISIDEDPKVTTINNWFMLAKNAIWILCLVAVASIKLNSIDNINAAQDDRIARIQKDNEALKATIDSINNKQVDQLVMLTKLLTITEQQGTNNVKPKGN